MTRLSYALAGYLGKQLGLNEDKTDILRYGFEVILGESAKLLVLFLLAALLDLTPYVLVSFLTIGSYRLFAGGYHSKTYGRCFVLTERKRQKKLSLLWVGFWFILVSSFLLLIPLEKSRFIILGTIMAHVAQTMSVTPAGFKLLQTLDNPGGKYNPKK